MRLLPKTTLRRLFHYIYTALSRKLIYGNKYFTIKVHQHYIEVSL